MKKWSRRSWLGGSLLLFLSVIAGVFGGLYYRNLHRLDRVLARLDQEEPGWRLKDLEAARKVIPPEENVGPLLFLGRKVFPVTPEFSKVDEQVSLLGPLEMLSSEQRAALRATLEKHQPILEETLPLRERGTGRQDIPYSADLVSTLMFHLDGLNGLRVLFRSAILAHVDEGNSSAAFEIWLRLCNGARAVGDEPIPISQLFRASAFLSGLPLLERILAQGQLRDEQLATAAQLIREEEAWPSLLLAIRCERAFVDAVLAKVQAGEIRLAPLRQMFGAMGRSAAVPRTGNATADELVTSFKTGSIVRARADFLEFVTELVAIARLPVEQQDSRYAEVLARIKKGSAFLQELLSYVAQHFKQYPRRQAGLRSALTALAVERYRLKHGRWPERLEDLVPAFLPALPTDPYTGSPLVYRQNDDGIVVYSVGVNGKDDQGDIEHRSDAVDKDVGFRLYNPERRKQPQR